MLPFFVFVLQAHLLRAFDNNRPKPFVFVPVYKTMSKVVGARVPLVRLEMWDWKRAGLETTILEGVWAIWFDP